MHEKCIKVTLLGCSWCQAYIQQIKMSSTSVSIGLQNIPHFWPVVHVSIRCSSCSPLGKNNYQMTIEWICPLWLYLSEAPWCSNLWHWINQHNIVYLEYPPKLNMHSEAKYAMCIWLAHLNDLPPSAAYMCQWIGTVLVQIMACRLFGDKPLFKPVLGYCQLDHWEQISVKFKSKYEIFHTRKCIWKCRLWNVSHFVQGEMN